MEGRQRDSMNEKVRMGFNLPAQYYLQCAVISTKMMRLIKKCAEKNVRELGSTNHQMQNQKMCYLHTFLEKVWSTQYTVVTHQV